MPAGFFGKTDTFFFPLRTPLALARMYATPYCSPSRSSYFFFATTQPTSRALNVEFISVRCMLPVCVPWTYVWHCAIGEWLFNKAAAMPWCHTVVHFEVKMSRFTGVFRDDRPNHGSTSAKQAVFLPR